MSARHPVRPRRAPDDRPPTTPGGRPSSAARARARRRRRGSGRAGAGRAGGQRRGSRPAAIVFPIYGTASFGDSFGAPRPDVPGGWHHGEDIFAAAGTPLARGRGRNAAHDRLQPDRRLPAVAAGHAGQRVLLRAPLRVLAARGRGEERSRPGDVIGFVGDTGDADGGAPHLHFEIHPVLDAGPRATTASSPRTRSSSRGGAPTTSRSRRGGSTCRPGRAAQRCRRPAPSCSRPTTSRRPAVSFPERSRKR